VLATSSPAAAPAIPRRAAYTLLALAWLVAVNLRTVLLAVPPVLPQIQQDLGLSHTATSLVTSLPTLLMGLAAVPGAFLVARVSPRSAIAVGLALLAAGTLLRALVPAALPLFAFTILLSLGIAVSQPALPVLVRRWFPKHIGLATGIYSNGLIIGEVLAATFTTSVLLWLGTSDWRVTFLFWGVPVVATLALWLIFAPRNHQGSTAAVMARWQAGWNTWRGWRMGLLLGSGSLVYFAMNTWIPEYDKALGRGAAYPDALKVLNAMQLPTSIFITVFAPGLAGRRWPFIFFGLLCTVGIFGWLFAPASTALLWVGMLGAGSSGVFLLGLALPPLLAREHEVAGYTGLLLTLGYMSAFLGPLIGGGLWDLSSIPALALLPVIVASTMQIVLGTVLPRPAPKEAS
jgi:CP family cyanate transporter-like MFS transporter